VEREAAQRLGGLLRMIHLVNSHPVQKLYDEGIVRFPNSRNEHVDNAHFQVFLGSEEDGLEDKGGWLRFVFTG